MSHRIATFDALVTGEGTFARVLAGRGIVLQKATGHQGLRVKLIRTDVQRGYIDFAREPRRSEQR